MGIYITVCVFIAFDIATGIVKALYNEGLNSTYLRKGLFHKLSEIIAVAGSGLLEYGLNYIEIGIDLPLLNVVAVYFVVLRILCKVLDLSSV